MFKGVEGKEGEVMNMFKGQTQTEYEPDGTRDVLRDEIRVGGVGRRRADGSSDGRSQPPICEPSLSIVSSLGGREEGRGGREREDALNTGS